MPHFKLYDSLPVRGPHLEVKIVKIRDVRACQKFTTHPILNWWLSGRRHCRDW